MICPHCRKPIKRAHPEELKAEALALLAKGYSIRDVESLLERRVSFGTVAKWARIAHLKEGDTDDNDGDVPQGA